jgi:hypothetical protein
VAPEQGWPPTGEAPAHRWATDAERSRASRATKNRYTLRVGDAGASPSWLYQPSWSAFRSRVPEVPVGMSRATSLALILIVLTAPVAAAWSVAPMVRTNDAGNEKYV